MCGDLEHNWTFLLCIDGNVGACDPGVGAKVPKSHIGVSEEQKGITMTFFLTETILVNQLAIYPVLNFFLATLAV